MAAGAAHGQRAGVSRGRCHDAWFHAYGQPLGGWFGRGGQSRLIPAIATALIGALDAPLGPWWVWLAFGEVPATVTLWGGVLVLGAVFGHLVAEARLNAARVRSSESRR